MGICDFMCNIFSCWRIYSLIKTKPIYPMDTHVIIWIRVVKLRTFVRPELNVAVFYVPQLQDLKMLTLCNVKQFYFVKNNYSRGNFYTLCTWKVKFSCQSWDKLWWTDASASNQKIKNRGQLSEHKSCHSYIYVS